MEGFLLRFREESINKGVGWKVCAEGAGCVCVCVRECLQGGVSEWVCKRWSVCVRVRCICGWCACVRYFEASFVHSVCAYCKSGICVCFYLCCVHMEIWPDVFI